MTEQTNGQNSPRSDDADGGHRQLAPAKKEPRKPRRTSNPPHVTEFFDRFHDQLEKMANELGVDKRLVMAQAAYECGWFRDEPDKNNYSRSNNNLFGYSKKRNPDEIFGRRREHPSVAT